MRNRLNIVWHGKRTTARFPEYLWNLALFASGLSDDNYVADEFLVYSVKCDAVLHGDDPLYRHYSASDFVIDQLVTYIEDALTPAGFNPGNSRARCPDTADFLEAAEAKPTTD